MKFLGIYQNSVWVGLINCESTLPGLHDLFRFQTLSTHGSGDKTIAWLYPSHANSKNAVVVDYLGQAKLRSWVAEKLRSKYSHLLHEAMQDESAKLCFIFRSARSVLYFPLENIVPEILLRIRCNKPVKVPLTLVHYGKYCTRVWSRGKYI